MTKDIGWDSDHDMNKVNAVNDGKINETQGDMMKAILVFCKYFLDKGGILL